MRPQLTQHSFSAARRVDENEPREPPPPPTPLQFPSNIPQKQPSSTCQQLDVVELFNNIIRTGAQLKHLEGFGVLLENNVRLDDLLIADFLPPNSWLDDPALTEGSDFTTTPPLPQSLSNGQNAPDRKAFYNLVKELMYDNGDAFRAARRQPGQQGRPKPHIIHSRRFWNGLADMAEYWDVSLDRYSDPIEEKDKVAMDIDELLSEVQEVDEKPTEQNKKKTYTGRRTDTGSKMPNRFREETVSGFVEMLVWAFGCTLENPTMQPKLYVHNILFHLPYLKSVHRVPKDPRRSRSGLKEGPLLGVLCRDLIKFREPNEPEGEGKAEILDLLRESGLMAMLAQKRTREGKEQVDPGAGKWWAERPRWGGGPGGEFGTLEQEPVVENNPQQQPGNAGAPPSRKRPKKMTQAEIWRAMRPPPSLWEKGITYQHVGKDKADTHDHVSSITEKIPHAN